MYLSLPGLYAVLSPASFPSVTRVKQVPAQISVSWCPIVVPDYPACLPQIGIERKFPERTGNDDGYGGAPGAFSPHPTPGSAVAVIL